MKQPPPQQNFPLREAASKALYLLVMSTAVFQAKRHYRHAQAFVKRNLAAREKNFHANGKRGGGVILRAYEISDLQEHDDLSLGPGNTHLVSALVKAFAELCEPLTSSVRAIWRGKESPPDGKSILHNQLILTAQRFVNIRECSDSERQRYFTEICRRFGLSCEGITFPVPDQGYFDRNILQKVNRTPATVSYLEEYDSRHGTNHTDKARSALFQFANLIIKSDGKVTKAEEAALLRFKETLYPPGSSALLQTEVSKDAHQEPVIETVEEEPPRSLDDLLAELNALVGLERVKAEIKELVNFLKVQRMRQEKGMSTLPVSRHVVFYGNPGTGKTTVARLLAQIYRALEILSTGHLTETDRAGLVAGYVGQTAIKVKEVVGKALGGILFIDEAYSLSSGDGEDFGREAIETLLKMMEDHRHELVVVVAGYTTKMDEFLSSNPGLRSRFNKFVHFEDYTPEQLKQIFVSFGKKADFKLTPAAEEKLIEVFKLLAAHRDESFGNARLARNLFEATISRQANRIVSLPEVNEEVLSTFEAEDLPRADEVQTHTDWMTPKI
jgi:AAA+ superfamily predicted ATPase